MATHLGVTADLDSSDLVPEHLISSRWLYMEGYLASSPSALQALAQARRIAREHGTAIALTFSDPAMASHFRDPLRQMIDEGVDLLFCNEEEACLFTGESDLERALAALRPLARRIVVTRGAAGSLILDAQAQLHIPAVKVSAIDSNGAGDAYAGAFLYGLTQDWDVETCAQLASRVAARVVSQFGPRLALAEYAALLQA